MRADEIAGVVFAGAFGVFAVVVWIMELAGLCKVRSYFYNDRSKSYQ